jgi:arabinofuranosyltransferase
LLGSDALGVMSLEAVREASEDRPVELAERPVELASPAARARALLPVLAVCLYLWAVVKMGWLADDAFASFRAASNLVNGHGLLSNPPERVQAFTNPLWTLLFALAYWPTKSTYGVAIVMGLVASLATAALVAYPRRVDLVARTLGVLALCLSPSFVDFSTSGLENPLSHALVIGAYLAARGGRATWLVALLAALLAVNRLDHLLLVAPLLVTRLWRAFRAGREAFVRELREVALGFLPLVAWELFALVYYGFPFPNTAYSKLNAAIPTSALVAQGLWYFMVSLARDPVAALVLGAGILAPLLARRANLLPFSLGLVLYLAYTLRVGGDFMAGRFLTAPFALAVVIVFHEVVAALERPLALAAGGLLLFVALAAEASPFVDRPPTPCAIPESGVVDERLCYRDHTGLAVNVRTLKYKTHEYYAQGRALRDKGTRVMSENVVGMKSFAAGPNVHLIDTFALTDPLLARIPYEPAGETFRIGHFSRELPAGYVDSVKTGKNRIKDPCIAAFYARLRSVTYGPLLSWQRVVAMWQLNLVQRTVTACP